MSVFSFVLLVGWKNKAALLTASLLFVIFYCVIILLAMLAALSGRSMGINDEFKESFCLCKTFVVFVWRHCAVRHFSL